MYLLFCDKILAVLQRYGSLVLQTHGGVPEEDADAIAREAANRVLPLAKAILDARCQEISALLLHHKKRKSSSQGRGENGGGGVLEGYAAAMYYVCGGA